MLHCGAQDPNCGELQASLSARLGTAWLTTAAGLLIAAIALVDWKIETNVGLGFLYFLPMLMLGVSLSRVSITVAAIMCTILREAFSSFAWGPEAVPRSAMVFVAFLGTGLYASELAKNRRFAVQHL